MKIIRVKNYFASFLKAMIYLKLIWFCLWFSHQDVYGTLYPATYINKNTQLNTFFQLN